MKNEVHKFIEVDTDLSTGLEEISDDEDIFNRLRTDEEEYTDLSTGLEEISDDEDILQRLRTEEEDKDRYPEYANEFIFKDTPLDLDRYRHTEFDDFENKTN